MFKNLILYRIGADWSATVAQVEESLANAAFVECGATQPVSFGWTWPRGTAHGPFIEAVAGQWLLRLMVEQKVLPAAVVKRRVDEMARRIEQSTGRKPGKKQARELKEEAVLELLPQAFTKQAGVNVWLSLEQRLLMLDAGSPARADDVVSQLVKALPGLSLTLLQTVQSASAAMSEWLVSGEPPAGFTVDRECELKSADEMKSVVRYSRHALDIDEVRQHIAAGKLPTRLALTWQGRVSFVLTETMQIRKLAFLDGVFEGEGQGQGAGKASEDAFDADVTIATGELNQLIPDLMEALGGEQTIGASAAPAGGEPVVPPLTTAAAAAAVAAAGKVATADTAAPW